MRESSISAAIYPIFELGMSTVVRWLDDPRLCRIVKAGDFYIARHIYPVFFQGADQVDGDEIICAYEYFGKLERPPDGLFSVLASAKTVLPVNWAVHGSSLFALSACIKP